MVRIAEMLSEDQIDLGMEFSSQDFSSGSLMNPTMSDTEEQATDQVAANSVAQGPDSAPEVAAVAVAPAAPKTPTMSTASSQTSPMPTQPIDWPGLVANDDNKDMELDVKVDNGLAKTLLTELIHKAKDSGQVLRINGTVQRCVGGLDRIKYLTQRLLAELAKHADQLHLASFRNSTEMRQIISLAQTLYCTESKYSAQAKFLSECNLETATARQDKYRAGIPKPIAVPDSPPAPMITRTVSNSSSMAPPASAPASTAIAAGARAPTSLTTSSGNPWPAPMSTSSGWNAPTSSSNSDWPGPSTSTRLVDTPPRPVDPVQAQGTDDTSIIEDLRNQVRALQSENDDYRNGRVTDYGRVRRRGNGRGRGQGRGTQRPMRWRGRY